jgi:hypothetical protein
MDLVLALYTALLFVVLTPGILLTLPKGGSKLTVAAVHGLVFAVVLYFTAKIVVDISTMNKEGFYRATCSSPNILGKRKTGGGC